MNDELDELDEKEDVAPEAVVEDDAAEEAEVVEEEVVEVDPVTALESELAKWKDEALRRMAEMENYRKRMAREMEEARKFANQGLLRELLPVLDNFGMGMQMAEQEQGSMLYQGMAMVQGQLDEFLTSQGAKVVELEAGADFDPNVHEAVSQEESTEVEEGKVLRVIRKGYVIGERLLRPANVVVAKAPEQEGGEEA
ncbi:MAG: nucleotide exchange factor GrpE [Verrucomicrobiota bacterium]